MRGDKTSKILVAGIGNIFLGDDGFGPEVIRRVPAHVTGPQVTVVDYGIRGLHLAYDLLDGYDAMVLVDALPDRGAPGALRVFEADHDTLAGTVGVDAHAMDPAAVFASLAALGGVPPYTVVIGCEVGDVDERMGLSPAVAAAVDEAAAAVEEIVGRLLAEAKAG